ncbi:hypothetical protein [Sphingobacterium sp. 2149]|uniref:hypothetical protein n=1 Tax=Sphingobacterium sp. 2149 TaxID=2817763 RepID=UPI001AE1753E|nr:hypothetical protein [Sphingobacterium sp. 2149]MDR6733642.1 hypothetical protein [Sphingobacterium sp. 2149]
MNIARVKVYLLFLFFLLSLQVYSQNRKDYFKTQIALGELTDPQLKEVSGIIAAASSGNFWVHNDSGDGAHIYLISREAQLLKKITLEGVSVVDCEDIDRVKIGDTYFLVLADIGNNLRKRTWVCLYVFPEPQAEDPELIPKKSIRVIYLKFPNHQRLDAESVMIDPIDKMLYLISKREFRSTVYSASVFSNPKQQYFTLDKVVELPLTFATGAALDPTGTKVLVKNITHIFYWQRHARESWEQVFKRRPTILPYQVEPQGEAITFDSMGSGFYTISERPFGLKSYLYFFEKTL